MSDIVSRLRESVTQARALDRAALLAEAADEVERLRSVLAGYAAGTTPEALVITREAYDPDLLVRLRHWRGLHIAHGGELFEQAADEIERLRITDAEREAVEYVVVRGHVAGQEDVATLCGLLERTR